MTESAEPMQRRTAEDGSKFYEHPFRTEDDGCGGERPARYRSVTTALTVVSKPALVFWASKLAARRAMENLPKLIAATRIEDCGRSRARSEPHPCGVCVACTQVWVELFHHGEKERRAREGSAAHDVLERWTLRGDWVYTPRPDWGEHAPTPDEIAPYIRSLRAFVDDFGLTPESWVVAECTVFNHTLKYGGTLDGIVDIRPTTRKAAEFCARINQSNGVADPFAPVRVVVDAKSREGEGAQFYAEYALQLAPYRHAETMLPRHAADAELELPMLATDAAAVLQVRPDGYTFRPVVTDGRTVKAWRAVLDLHAWSSELGDWSTQVQAFPRPAEWTAPTWERATMPGGGLCGCAYCDDPADGRCQFGGSRPIGAHTREVTVDGTPVAAKAKAATPAKRAPAKKAAGAAPKAATPGTAAKRAAPTVVQQSATMRSMRVPGAELRDEDIPF